MCNRRIAMPLIFMLMTGLGLFSIPGCFDSGITDIPSPLTSPPTPTPAETPVGEPTPTPAAGTSPRLIPSLPVIDISTISEKWSLLRPAFRGSTYLEAPSTKAPYSTGKLADGFLQDGINMANFVRFLAGIPSDLELDPALCEQAQYGAVVLAAIDQLTHTPSKPADMDQAFYDKGYKSTTSSNLYSGQTSLADSAKGYMDDSDCGNIDRVGHRRWILNPQMKKTGFGLADGYTPMQVFDSSRTEHFDYSFVAWPAAGNFPTAFFGPGTAWSISLNPGKFNRSTTSAIQVKLTRKTDGTEWLFDASDRDTSGKYFNVETTAYGIGFCIIFRPETTVTYSDNDRFNVVVTGLFEVSGNPAVIDYDVTFFNLKKYPLPSGFETIDVDCGGGVPMTLVKVPAGTIRMGDISGVGQANERPVHTVTISNDYYMGVYEVTQLQWKAVMGTEPWKDKIYVIGPSDFSDYPATYIRWAEAVAFCNKLQELNPGRTFRLPTEAEWERACRAGTETDYYFGNDSSSLDEYVSLYGPVGEKIENGFGLFDMHGNVREWCSDWYGDYTSDPVTDPTGPSIGDAHILRGGSWEDSFAPTYFRSANRNSATSSFDWGLCTVGFRVVSGK